MVYRGKIAFSVIQLSEGLPVEYKKLLSYARWSLKEGEVPDYALLKSWFD